MQEEISVVLEVRVTGNGDAYAVDGADLADDGTLTDHLAEIRAALARGEQPPAGALLGLPDLPGDVWVDMVGAATVVGVQPRTITQWVSRNEPKCCPFPTPYRYLYRLYWPLMIIESWHAEYSSKAN